MTTVADLEKAAQNIVQGVMDHEGLINIVAGAVGILPEVALAEKLLPLIAGVLQYMQGQGGGSLQDVFKQLVNTVVPGQPNSPILTGPSQDPSAQGSGIISPQP